jgi:hypothetical protein
MIMSTTNDLTSAPNAIPPYISANSSPQATDMITMWVCALIVVHPLLQITSRYLVHSIFISGGQAVLNNSKGGEEDETNYEDDT